MKEWIAAAAEGRDLRRGEAAAAMRCIMEGEATGAQIAALLMALRMKGETVDEIAGCAAVMREKSAGIPGAHGTLLDLCGTGGDGSGSINVSTLASLVAAGEGARVAKHGNRSVSSRCGSADLLEAMGVPVDLAPEAAGRCLQEAGIAFLFAPRMHPAMGHAAGPRREMGVRTLFNLLGPLTNPAGAQRQVMGVYDGGLVERMAQVTAELGSEHVMVVHGAGGLDEISLAGETRVAEMKDGEVRCYSLQPQDVGLAPAPVDAIRGGDVDENVAIARRVLAGEPGPVADVVALNAGAGLYVAGIVASLEEGVVRAREGLLQGRAAQALERLRLAARAAA